MTDILFQKSLENAKHLAAISQAMIKSIGPVGQQSKEYLAQADTLIALIQERQYLTANINQILPTITDCNDESIVMDSDNLAKYLNMVKLGESIRIYEEQYKKNILELSTISQKNKTLKEKN